jgi:hypothetical protein
MAEGALRSMFGCSGVLKDPGQLGFSAYFMPTVKIGKYFRKGPTLA